MDVKAGSKPSNIILQTFEIVCLMVSAGSSNLISSNVTSSFVTSVLVWPIERLHLFEQIMNLLKHCFKHFFVEKMRFLTPQTVQHRFQTRNVTMFEEQCLTVCPQLNIPNNPCTKRCMKGGWARNYQGRMTLNV